MRWTACPGARASDTGIRKALRRSRPEWQVKIEDHVHRSIDQIDDRAHLASLILRPGTKVWDEVPTFFLDLLVDLIEAVFSSAYHSV